MTDYAQSLADFHRLFGVTNSGSLVALCHRRAKLHAEEHQELLDSLDDLSYALKPNERELKEAVARELADVLYIAFGTAHLLGISLDHAFEAVHAANLAKLPDCDDPSCIGGEILDGDASYMLCGTCGGSGKGAPIRRESDQKVMKPESWQPPSMERAVRG